MCDHTNEPGGREAAMTVIDRDDAGTPTVWCDPCIAPLITALNEAGLSTIASCCGHGRYPGWVMLRDGRDIVIYPDHESNLAVNDPVLLASLQSTKEAEPSEAPLLPNDCDCEDREALVRPEGLVCGTCDQVIAPAAVTESREEQARG